MKKGNLRNNTYPETRQTTRMLFILIIASWVTYLIIGIVGFVEKNWDLPLVTGIGIISQVVPLWLIKGRHLNGASFLVTLNVLGTVVIIATVGQGSRDVAVVAFPIVLILAGFTLNRALFVWFTTITLVASFWLVFGETLGWYTPLSFAGTPNWPEFITLVVILLVAAFAIDRLALNNRQSLDMTHQEIEVRKKTEQVLRQSEARMSAITSAANDAIIMMDTVGKISYWNPAAERILGYNNAEAIGQDLHALFVPEQYRAAQVNAFPEFRQTGRGAAMGKTLDLTARHKSGKEISVQLSLSGIQMDDGWHAVGIIRDVTERKQHVEVLARLNQQKETILASAAEGIIGLDLQGKHSFVNPSAERILGYTAEELIGRFSHSLWHHTKADGSPHHVEECPIYAAYKEGKVHHSSDDVFWRKDGTSFSVEYYSRPAYENGKLVGAVLTFTDVTEQKMSEQLIRTQAEVTNNMTEGAYIIGLHDGIIYWTNRHFEDMFGYSHGEMVGKHVSIVNAPSDVSAIDKAAQIMDLITSAGEWHGEVKNIRKDGTTFWCAASVSTFIHHQYGAVMLALHTDISDRKQAEDKIKASLAEKETLLKEIHHRVKNNMQVISSLLQLQSGFVKDKQDVHLFRESQDRIKSMSLVYNKLYQSHDLANINLKDYLTELVENLVRAYNLSSDQVGIAIDVDNTVIGLDLAIPCGLIANEIVVNSLKYAFTDGRKGLIHLSAHTSGSGEIEIKIGDNGVGLPENAGPGTTRTLGMILIQTLVQEQLCGKVQINRNCGTEYVINFMLNTALEAVNGKD
jgi:PAS domain S-box-containing protein